MSEYWKSTPKYWCKHCSLYVRDTALERRNHEATGKHQGALKRFLRNLHRDHEIGLREQDRAKREVDRLNGVIPSSSSSSSSSAAAPAAPRPPRDGSSSGAAAPQRQTQWEQLAEMGIDIPTELRGDMAMAGEWSVTNTRVVDDALPAKEEGEGPDDKTSVGAVATGVRKRQPREGEEEEEAAIRGLFKKPRTWGRSGTRLAPGEGEGDDDLDALLSGSLVKKGEGETKVEGGAGDEGKLGIKEQPDDKQGIKEEPDESGSGVAATAAPDVPVKQEDVAGSEAAPAVVFKKRKHAKARQK